MRSVFLNSFIFLMIILLSSCQNRPVSLLSKKWDCVKIENIDSGGSRFLSPQDSLNKIQLQAVLETLNWTFYENMEYECAVGGNITTRGTYELMDNARTLVCTPETKNSVNRYIITSLTEYDLVLTGMANNKPVILHFKPR